MKTRSVYKSRKNRGDIERMIALEITQKNLMDQLIQFNNDNKEQHSQIFQVLKGLEDKLDLALEKKANKWVEKVIIGAIAFLLTGIFGYLGTLIIKTVLHLG